MNNFKPDETLPPPLDSSPIQNIQFKTFVFLILGLIFSHFKILFFQFQKGLTVTYSFTKLTTFSYTIFGEKIHKTW